MRRYGGTLSTMGRTSRSSRRPSAAAERQGFGRQERRVASTRVTFVGRIPNHRLLHVFAGR